MIQLLDELAYQIILQDAKVLEGLNTAAGYRNYTNCYLLANRIPVPCPNWLEWKAFMKNGDRAVRVDQVTDDIRVSTMFLGLDDDRSGMREPEPLLFETVVRGGEWNQYKERYSSWTEAEEGHQRWVEMVKPAMKPDE